jgi:protein subunit release factor B
MRELLFSVTKKDLRIDYFRAGGPGGQHQNKTASACRITHVASGAVGESREERSQEQNRKIAFRRMTGTTTFKLWAKRVTSEYLTGESLEQRVDKQLEEKNLKVEVKDKQGRWIDEKPTPQKTTS